MRVTRRKSFAWAGACVGFMLALALLWLPLATAAEEPDQAQVVRPSPKKFFPPGYETPQDGPTVYLNDHDGGPFFVFGTAAPRLSNWGEHITLVPNTPALLAITSIEFSVQPTATSTFVPRVRVWDVYNTAGTPVNSGLLRTEDVDYGTATGVPVTQFYRAVLFPFSSPLLLADPDVFIQFTYSATAGGPPSPIFRQIADGNSAGPQHGTSENDVYVDEDGDGMFTFSAPNAGDRRLISNTTICGPSDCQTNYAWHVRGLTVSPIRESTFNSGGHPGARTNPASASHHLTLGAIGDGAVAGMVSSPSFRLDGNFVSAYPPPGETLNLRFPPVFPSKVTLQWTAERSAGDYNLYRAALTSLPGLGYGFCYQQNIPGTTADEPSIPSASQGFFYLVTVENRLNEEGTKGFASSGAERTGTQCP